MVTMPIELTLEEKPLGVLIFIVTIVVIFISKLGMYEKRYQE